MRTPLQGRGNGGALGATPLDGLWWCLDPLLVLPQPPPPPADGGANVSTSPSGGASSCGVERLVIDLPRLFSFTFDAQGETNGSGADGPANGGDGSTGPAAPPPPPPRQPPSPPPTTLCVDLVQRYPQLRGSLRHLTVRWGTQETPLGDLAAALPRLESLSVDADAASLSGVVSTHQHAHQRLPSALSEGEDGVWWTLQKLDISESPRMTTIEALFFHKQVKVDEDGQKQSVLPMVVATPHGLLNPCLLEVFVAHSTQLLSINALQHCRSLKQVNVSDTAITSLAGLEGLAWLEAVDCASTAITSLKPLQRCPNLRRIAAPYCRHLSTLDDWDDTLCTNNNDDDNNGGMVKKSAALQQIPASGTAKFANFNFKKRVVSRLEFLDITMSAVQGLPLALLSRNQHTLRRLRLNQCAALHPSAWLGSTAVGQNNDNNTLLLTNLVELSLDTTNIDSLLPLARCPSLQTLSVRSCRRLASLRGIETCKDLQTLVAERSAITSLAALAHCRGLRKLEVHGCDQLTSLAGIESLPFLEDVNAVGVPACAGSDGDDDNSTALSAGPLSTCLALRSVALGPPLKSLDPILSQQELRWLTTIMLYAAEIDSLLPLARCPSLQTLSVRSCRRLASLRGIETCKDLQTLVAERSAITSLAALAHCRGLRKLEVHGCEQLTSLAGIEGLPFLEDVNAASCPALATIQGLQGCVALRKLRLSHCAALTSLEGVERLPYLMSVIADHSAITSLRPLEDCPSLRHVYARGCSSLNRSEVDASMIQNRV